MMKNFKIKRIQKLKMLDDWHHYIEDFIQVVPIEYKRVLEEEKMARLHEKIADIQRDY